MRLIIATGAFPFYPIRLLLRTIQASGADGLELLLSGQTLRRGAAYYHDLALSHGMPILAVHERLRWVDQSFQQQSDDLSAAIAFAAQIPTCSVVTLHPPLASPDQIRNDTSRWLEAIEAARRQYDPERRLRIAIENRPENHDGRHGHAFDDPRQLRSIALEWDLGLTFDIAHAASMEWPLGSVFQTWEHHLSNVHLSDAGNRSYRGGLLNGLLRDHRLPGNGALPVGEFMQLLGRRSYAGLVTVETSPMAIGAWSPRTAAKRLRNVVEYLREQVETVEYPSTHQRRHSPRGHSLGNG